MHACMSIRVIMNTAIEKRGNKPDKKLHCQLSKEALSSYLSSCVVTEKATSLENIPYFD